MRDDLRARLTRLTTKTHQDGESLPTAKSTFAEQVALGAVLSKSAHVRDLDCLDLHAVSTPKHGVILHAMREMNALGFQITASSIAQHIINKESGLKSPEEALVSVGGLSYLIDLDSMPKIHSVDHYVEIIRDNQLATKWLAEVLSAADGVLRGEDIDQAKDTILKACHERTEPARQRSDNMMSAGQIVTDYETFFGVQKKGCTTGIPKLDKDTYGLHGGELVIIGARPSDGKTALLTQMGVAAAIAEGKRVEIISLEMAKEQLLLRSCCQVAGVSFHRVRSGEITEDERADLIAAHQRITQAPFFIDDSVSWNVNTIRQHVRQRHQAGEKIDILGIDYLQLMPIAPGMHKDRRDLELAEITRGLKLVAREFACCIVLLSQLSRKSETDSRKPHKGDLRDSGSIEADADVIFLLWHDRAKYKGNGYFCSEVIIDKQRNGPTGPVAVFFDRENARFLDRN